MTKYLLLLTLMMPAFLVEQADAGRERQGRLKCYLVRGEVNNAFIHGYVYLTKESVQLLRGGGLSLQRKPPKDCDAMITDEDDD